MLLKSQPTLFLSSTSLVLIEKNTITVSEQFNPETFEEKWQEWHHSKSLASVKLVLAEDLAYSMSIPVEKESLNHEEMTELLRIHLPETPSHDLLATKLVKSNKHSRLHVLMPSKKAQTLLTLIRQDVQVSSISSISQYLASYCQVTTDTPTLFESPQIRFVAEISQAGVSSSLPLDLQADLDTQLATVKTTYQTESLLFVNEKKPPNQTETIKFKQASFIEILASDPLLSIKLNKHSDPLEVDDSTVSLSLSWIVPVVICGLVGLGLGISIVILFIGN